MKYFTKEWYRNGCLDSECLNSYYDYYEMHQKAFPDLYNKISFHDAHLLHNEMDRGVLSIEFLIDSDNQTVVLKLTDPQILEGCNLTNKICLAVELYVQNGYEFSMLLCDMNNNLYEFTVACSNINLDYPDALSIFSLAAFCIPGISYYYDEYGYDCLSKHIVCFENAEPDNSNSLLPLPKMKNTDLLYVYLKQLNNEKINAYLNLFGNDISSRIVGEQEICLKNTESMMPISETHDFYMYCLSQFLPIVNAWSRKTGVKVNCRYKQIYNRTEPIYSCDQVYVPTDGMKIYSNIYFCLEKNNCWDKKTYFCKAKDNNCHSEECIDFPFVNEEDIKQSFWKMEDVRNSEDDPESSKNINRYLGFRDNYLNEILIKWCIENNITYIE